MISISAFDFPQLIHSSVEQAELDPSEKVVGANKIQESLRKYTKGWHTHCRSPRPALRGRAGGRSGCLRHCGSVGAKMGQKTWSHQPLVLWVCLPLLGVQSSPSPSSGRGTLVSSASVTWSWGLEVGAEKQKKWGKVMRIPLPARRKVPATTKEAV